MANMSYRPILCEQSASHSVQCNDVSDKKTIAMDFYRLIHGHKISISSVRSEEDAEMRRRQQKERKKNV